MRQRTWIGFVGAVGLGLGLLASPSLWARGGWSELPTVYCYEADEIEPAYVATDNTIGNLDGEWRRSNNSDEWDGSTPEPGDGAPGGVWIEVIPDEGEDGGDATVLSIEDVGNPTQSGFPDPSNRKIFLWRDTTDELDLANGITLVARWRRNPEPASAEFVNNGGTLPVPDGSFLHDGGKGQIGFVQKSAVAGTIPATLALAITDLGYLQFAADIGGECIGNLFPSENCLEVDPEDWVSVWMAAQEEAGQVRVLIYVDGDTEPAVDTVLTPPAGAETATLPETGGTAASYLLMALGATGQSGAIQIDYLCVTDGFFEPSNFNPACPGAAKAVAEGTDVRLTWTNGDVTPASVEVIRSGESVAVAAPADTEEFVDDGVPPGSHEYELIFDVTGETCDSLTTSVNTCPSVLTAVPAPNGVFLRWTSAAVYEGLSLSRNGVEIDGAIAGDATSYTDESAPEGSLTYTLAPTTGTCDPLEATIDFVPVTVGSGDFNDAFADWSYILDPPPDADPEEYLLHNPVANQLGDLDGDWTSGNGSDSWDGSAPGEIGDPLLDVAGTVNPASAAPGGIGLVTDGDVGAYLLEDTGDPTGQGWLDPSNRKLYLSYDVWQAVPDANERSLLSDGMTLRVRLRLTSAETAVDVANAPNGYNFHTDGKGMVVFAHDAGTTLVGQSQRIGMVLDVNPDVPGTGLLRIGGPDDDRGDGLATSSIVVPVPDPTRWLDVWMTVEDADGDPLTPQLLLALYLNGSSDPSLVVEDYIPNLQGVEGVGTPLGNQLVVGLGATDQDGSYELDLVAFVDEVVEPEGGPVETVFHRGDADGDGAMNITDGIFVLNYLFLGGPTPTCLEAANGNDDAEINITDGIYILNYLFLGGPAPPAPGPADSPCGPDPAGSPSDLGCESYTNC